MKKFYSLVLMATALLIGTNVWAGQTRTASDATSFEQAWKNAQDGDVIQLRGNISISNTLWLGTATMGDETNVKSITLDLNGDTLSSTAQKMFVLSHGSLKVKNGVINHDITPELKSDGKGGLEYSSQIIVFLVYGSTYKDVDPANLEEGQDYYTHLTIGADVKVHAAVCGIVVDKWSSWIPTTALPTKGVTLPTTTAAKTALYTNVYGGNGVAHGVCIDVEGYIQARKYAIKANGNLSTPEANKDKIGTTVSGKYSDRSNTPYVIAADDAKKYSPYIHIYGEKAKLLTTELTRTDAVAAYGGGYARWLVEGAVEGSTAVYVKSGEIELKNAQITSNFEGTASGSTADRKSGVDAGGSGLVIESSANYAGGTDVTVSGNTVITPTSGYAMEEKITDIKNNSKVDSIKIQGGTFHEGEAGTIVVTQVTANNQTTSVAITGGTVEGGNAGTTIGDKNLSDFLQGQTQSTHATTVKVDDEGNETIVISEGAAPVVANSVIAAAQDASINWINDVTTTETLTDDKKLAELQISQDYNQTLIIPAGKTLEVGRVVLGAKAQIVVKAGGALIVTGNQGIAAFQASNLILEADENNQATFLLAPAVVSNTHPMAKVQYNSNSFFNTTGNFNVEQFFGIPTYNGAVTDIETESTAKIYFDVWRGNHWDYIGAINVPGDPNVMANLAKFNSPFGLYDITSKNDADHKPSFTFSGELTGNMDHTFTLLKDWTTLANAYMGQIDKTAIFAQLDAWNASYGTKQAIYYYEVDESTGTIKWTARTKYNPSNIGVKAMQPMMFYNGSAVEGLELDYSALVWEPYVTPAAAPAPARRTINNITKAQINIAGENDADHTTIVADSELGEDRSFCAPKYNNPGLQLYVMANEKYDVYAADEIENSYIGYRTVNAGMYTISFENVEGEDLVLVDLANGARTNIEEGAIYTFHAEANESNDYRFEIVGRANMPTAIDNTEAVKSAKGVYTITGQYVGEMNVWNTLPAGVYVVNGEKRVK